jgi:type II secretory pathway component PulJ
MIRRRERIRERRGGLKSFSLVEILVATAILSILSLVLLEMLSSLTTAWQAGQAHNERRTIAQAVLDRMSRDFSQVPLPSARTQTNALQLIINPSGVSAPYENPEAIFCQSPVATDSMSVSKGNLAVVGYFVEWINGTAGSPGTPSLLRVLINPSSSDYSLYNGSGTWISDALLQSYASGTSANNYAGLLAENVLGLWVQALDPQGKAINQGVSSANIAGESFDSRFPYSYVNSANYTATNMATALPSSLQVAIVVVDSRTAKQFARTGKPSYPALSGNFWADVQGFYNGLPAIIQKGAEIQTITIPVANGPR